MRVDATIDTDVLIIGGGGAALRAAVAACDHGVRTTVVLKGSTGKCGATVSPDSPGVAWQVADSCSGCDDGPEVHFRNIVEAGLGVADPRLARILAYETVDRTEEIERWGLPFVPDPEHTRRHYSGYSCFGDQPRAHGIANSGYGHAGDLVRILVEQLRLRRVERYEGVLITDLVVEDGRCAGAVGIGSCGEILDFRAGAVVLAAGGARQIYPYEPGRTRIDTTGDGYAMAFRAGAELTNMEFTQYMLHPVPPFPLRAPGVFWALCPAVKNKNGEDGLAPHLPLGVEPQQVMRQRTLHYPFSSRDCSKWLDIALAREIRAGRGTEQGGLYLDFSRVDLSQFQPSRPQHLPDDRRRPIQLPDQLVQVRPVAHAINGGILINETAESSLSGLFAVGEAATGSHGADRLGGCMVSAGQVFGARAGRFAAEHARSCAAAGARARAALEPPLERLRSYGQGSCDAEDVLSALQQAAGQHLVALRTAAGLESLRQRIRELIEQQLPRVAADTTAALRRAVEVHNGLITAELMAQAALLRTESRGSHFREDCPSQDDTNWRLNLIARSDGNHGISWETRTLSEW